MRDLIRAQNPAASKCNSETNGCRVNRKLTYHTVANGNAMIKRTRIDGSDPGRTAFSNIAVPMHTKVTTALGHNATSMDVNRWRKTM